MGQHSNAPHVLEWHPMLSTQYGPICRICGNTPQSRWHIAARSDHRRAAA